MGQVDYSTGPQRPLYPRASFGNLNHRTIDITLALTVRRFTDFANAFQTASRDAGFRLELSKPDAYDNRNIALITKLRGRSLVALNIVDNAQRNTTYSIDIRIRNRSYLTVYVDGLTKFSYSLPPGSLLGSFSNIEVGNGYNGFRPLIGAVSPFRIAVTTPSNATTTATWWPLDQDVTSLLLASSAFSLVTLAGIATRRRVVRMARRVRRRKVGLLSFIMLAANAALLVVVTPPSNAVMRRVADENVNLPLLHGEAASDDLADAPILFKQYRSVDTAISFEINPGTGSSTDFGKEVVGRPYPNRAVMSTFDGATGVEFDLIGGNKLTMTLGGLPFTGAELWVVSNHLPSNRWSRVILTVTNNQTFSADLNGQQVQAFVWNIPILNTAPGRFGVHSVDRSLVRDVQFQASAYVPGSISQRVWVRTVQGLAIALLTLSCISLCCCFLSSLVPRRRRTNRHLARIAFSVLVVGIIANIIVDGLHLQHDGTTAYYEHNSWLLTQYPRFADFFQVASLLHGRAPYGVAGGTYPPFAYWLTAPFAWLPDFAALYTFLAVAVGFVIWWTWQAIASPYRWYEALLMIGAVLCSLPVSFALDRGNVESILFAMLVLAVGALERNRIRQAAVWVGLMTAAKLYPAIYLLLFLKRGSKRYVALTVGVAGFVTCAALVGFSGSFASNVHGAVHILGGLSSIASNNVQGTTYNASLSAWVRAIGFVIDGNAGSTMIQNTVVPALRSIGVIVGLGGVGHYVTSVEHRLWRRVMLVTMSLLLFGQLSNYYEVLFVLVPFALFLRDAETNRTTIALAIALGFVIAPRAYFYLGNFLDVSVLTTAPLLLVGGVLVCVDGARERASSLSRRNDQSASLSNEDIARASVDLLA